MLDKTRQRIGVVAAPLVPLALLGLLIVSLFLLGYGYLADPSAFNSDDLLSCAQCDDLLHGRDLTDWYLPGAPYLFPDLLFLAPCQALSSTTCAAFLAYCFLLHLSMTAVLCWLGRLSGLGWRSALTAACCGVLLLAALNLSGEAGQPNHLAGGRNCLLVRPGSHAAAIVVGLVLLALTLRALRRGPSWKAVVLYVLIGGLGGFSDQLVFVQFHAPLALALLVLAARRVVPFKQAGGQVALLAASLLLASAIKAFLKQLGFHFLTVPVAIGKPRLSNLLHMLRFLYQFIADDRLLCALIPLHLIAALLVVYEQTRRSCETPDACGRNRPVLLLASLTFVLSPLCILATLFLAGMTHHAAIGRYTLSCWFLPALLLPLLLCWLPGRTAWATRVVLQLGIVLLAAQRAAVLLPALDAGKWQQPYPPLAQALDRLARTRGLRCGLAGFWTARAASWFTREHVRVNALSPYGQPFFHASNAARFLPDGKELHIPDYQFLIVRPGETFAPSPALLTLHFGEPREKIVAGGGEIWLYRSLRTPPFERFLRSRLAARLRRLRPYIGPVEPACLAKPKANRTPADAPGTIALQPGQCREVRFARPIHGQLLDIGASFRARLDLDFYRGDERLAGLLVPSVPWTGGCPEYGEDGIQSRLLPAPATLQGQVWDRLVVRARPKGVAARLAHILVYAQSIPGLDSQRPAPRPLRLRFEAEELFPLNPGTPYSDEADDAASGGRVRRAAVDFRCPVAYTPSLFLSAGRYRLNCILKVDSKSSAEDVATLFVGCLSPPVNLAKRTLHSCDFAAAGRWETHQVTFEVPEEMENIQFGVVDAGTTPIRVDYFDLIAEPPVPN